MVGKYKRNVKACGDLGMGWGHGAVSQKSSLGALKIRSALDVQDVPPGTDVRGPGSLRLQNAPLGVRDIGVHRGAPGIVLLTYRLRVVMDSALPGGGCGRLGVRILPRLRFSSTQAVRGELCVAGGCVLVGGR